MVHLSSLRHLSALLLLLAVLLATCEATSATPKRMDAHFASALFKDSPLGSFLPFGKKLRADDLITDDWIAALKAKRGPVIDVLTPVVIIPPLLGTRFNAYLDGAISKHWYCWSKYSEFTLWVSTTEFYPFFIDCWYEHMPLQFNETTGLSHNATGVFVTLPKFGGVDGIEYIDGGNTFGMWNYTIEVLQAIGYEAGKNIRGAPFDWRVGPYAYQYYEFPMMKSLIEDTYAINNNTPVALISLSMGCPYVLAFLSTYVSQEWKDKYIHSFTSWDGAYGGSLSALLSMATPRGWLSEYFDPKTILSIIQSYPSIVWLMPWEQVFGPDRAWISNAIRKYATKDFSQLLSDTGSAHGPRMLKKATDEGFLSLGAPGVEVHCFYGYGVDTPSFAEFNSTDFSAVPHVVMADGDGTILEAGLRLLERFQDKQEKGIYMYPIKGLVHGSSVSNKELLRMFLEILAR